MAHARLEGVAELQKVFNKLGKASARRVMRTSANKGAAEIRKEMKKLAPRSKVKRKEVFGGHKYEYLAKHLYQHIKSTKVKAKEADVKYLVHTGDGFWGYFLEWGTKHIAARHWFEKAWNKVVGKVEPSVIRGIEKGVDREVAKLGK